MGKEKAHLSLVVIGHADAGRWKSSALNGHWGTEAQEGGFETRSHCLRIAKELCNYTDRWPQLSSMALCWE